MNLENLFDCMSHYFACLSVNEVEHRWRVASDEWPER